MADFRKAFLKTSIAEGGYSNNSLDMGGETYRGISRRYFPDWKGWEIIDIEKKKPGPNPVNDISPSIRKGLNDLVEFFYKENFWNRFLGDEIPNQEIAEELYDTSVNMGISRGVIFLQVSLNVLNRNGELYPDIVEDGKIGSTTIRTLNTYLKYDKPELLLKIMNVLQGMHYIEFMKKSPTQEAFARGWFSRVEINKG
uniref:Putative glycoside hydrolase n=1 Tax=viral metagenome TaxID=1070528 RepID=A0A6M3JNR8_9ZZZZ